MPKRYRSQRFNRRVLRVLRNECETKRVVQTKRNCKVYGALRAVEPLTANTYNNDNNGAENSAVWKLTHNRIQVWPVCLHTCGVGTYSGYENVNRINQPNIRNVTSQSVRIGKEIWCKGISLKFSVMLDPTVPYANVNIMLVRSKKGDTPRPDGWVPAGYQPTDGNPHDDPNWRDSNFYLGYSMNKQLDMVNTQRHHIIKTWRKKLYQFQPTTVGGPATARGNAVFNMNTAKPDAYVVLKDPDGLTAAEWLAKIEEEYPDHYIMTKDHNVQRSAFDGMLLNLGYDASLKTLVAHYDFTDWGPLSETTPPTAKTYAVVDDQNNNNATTDIWDMYNNAGLNNVLSTAWFDDTNTTYKAHQVVLVEKPLGAGAPTQDMIQFAHNKVIEIWIPGSYIKRGGKFRYADIDSNMADSDFGQELEGMYEYNLLFYAYGNFMTWTVPGAGSEYPKLVWFNDFQQVMYFKDP